jgi:excinuclease ABC subunit C
VTPQPWDALDLLPDEPGVYTFIDREGRVVYVGKAKSLRDRVRSYFQPGSSDTRYFIPLLRQVVADIETTVTSSEKNAAILENNFIKEHQPRYNTRLRDDKDFLHLRIDLDAQWPRLELVRRPRVTERGGSVKIFGPYHSARSARRTMLLASRSFRLRTCADSALRGRSRPCLLHQMKRCPGPCVFEVDRGEYLEQVHLAVLFLSGRHGELAAQLRDRMNVAAVELAFERAALYRDQLKAVEATLADQEIVHLGAVDEDVFGLCREQDQVQVVVLHVRGGRATGRVDFHWKGRDAHLDEHDLLSSIVAQFYEPGVSVPEFVVVPSDVDDAAVLGELLGERCGHRVTVLCPRRGRRRKLVLLAQANARQALVQRSRSSADLGAALEGVARMLGLERPPRLIECIDVAHHGSGRAVAAVARLRDGVPDRSGTRSFTVKVARTGDDYGSMYEVLSRRFRRAREDDDRWALADLLVVDGGRGQLGVAQAALRDTDLERDGPALVALAKERPARPGPEDAAPAEALEDRVYVPGRANPLTIRGGSPLRLLCLARDEAHRLAGKLLSRQRKSRTTTSPLQSIPGVGPKLRAALLRGLGSHAAVKNASIEELETVSGVGPTLARTIFEHFHGKDET